MRSRSTTDEAVVFQQFSVNPFKVRSGHGPGHHWNKTNAIQRELLVVFNIKNGWCTLS
jgi:hypothetical protein